MEYNRKVATIHDLSGYGRCSLAVVLPVLTVMGAQNCAIPTAYLSAHTGFQGSTHSVFLDMTAQMEGTMAHWKELEVSFQGIYSGFLGSAQQIDLLESFIDTFKTPQTLVLVDPVMGDHGKPYRTYTDEMCQKMSRLAAKADLITPNLTEAALLLGLDYRERPTTQRGFEGWIQALSLNGTRSVILTGISLEAGTLGAGCLEKGCTTPTFFSSKEERGQLSGTGDLFASVVLGYLLQGKALVESTQKAVEFVAKCMAYTNQVATPPLEGVVFEPLLHQLLPHHNTSSKECT